MKTAKLFALLLTAALVLTSCTARPAGETPPTATPTGTPTETTISLSDSRITVDGLTASTDPTAAVYTGAEIVYYRDGTDESYGEGNQAEKHSAAEAAAHTVVTITQPGAYRLTGALSQGQIAVDLGKDAKDDPAAVVTLILDNANVTCTVAPALIFYNVYECDRAFVAYDNDENPDYQAASTVDTTAAGANIILADGSENTFTGSHVARVYKEGTTKKLHKYDGAFYSKMSMNIDGEAQGTGILNIIADNEGLGSELHLTLNGGNINIESQNDGINTNEDFVSVTAVNGGTLTVNAGNGAEGDGIDSNGYLVINGGTVWTMANETSPDGGVDAESPIILNGGTLSAFGTRNDAADSTSAQPYMELSFASTLPAGSLVELKDDGGATLWSATTQKKCQSITLTAPELKLDATYHLYVDGVLQCYSGNSFGMMGGPGGQRPDGMTRLDGQTPPEMPTDGQTPPERPTDGQTPPEPPAGGQTPPEPPAGGGSTDFVLTAETKSFSGVRSSDASGKTGDITVG